ncbi:uncharacterized protein admb [Syngnathus scovelli]|uniref:uncharacterized protein admb n=1 Tax=Syngnathus scovelli TaxID=161590 RepID=UPI0035CAAEBD
MRLALHTLVCCCCVLTAVMPQARSIALRKRFKGRLAMKRDVSPVLIGAPQQGGEPKMEWADSSLPFNIRRRRAPSKTSGCFLFSCSYHELIHRLSQMHDNDKKVASAPKDKMNSIGRRRRRGTDEPTEAPAPRSGPEEIACWVCLLSADKDPGKASLDESLGRTPSEAERPRPTRQALLAALPTKEDGVC